MFLQRLTLSNVKSFKELEIVLTQENGNTRAWTLILGENGTGKSTILKSAALLLAGSDALPELLVRPDDWIRLGASSCSLHADIVTAEGEERTVDLE
jgi:DNA repair exonuclease SbcCD ATPase subunit